jgi:hypothetical protein
MKNMNNFSTKTVNLNSSYWKYDSDDTTPVISRGERIVAFRDSSSRDVCVKFLLRSHD